MNEYENFITKPTTPSLIRAFQFKSKDALPEDISLLCMSGINMLDHVLSMPSGDSLWVKENQWVAIYVEGGHECVIDDDEFLKRFDKTTLEDLEQ